MALLPTFALALRLLGFRRTLVVIQGRGHSGRADALSAEQAQQLDMASRMIAVASRNGIHDGSCLTKSLVLLYLMRRTGLRGTLVIGSRRSAGAFDAHAWVECGGKVINDQPDVCRRFTAFGNLGIR